MLHSVMADARWGRWSILAAEPARVLEVADTKGPDPFAELAQHVRSVLPSATAAVRLPFCGGWIGYFAYEAGAFLERLPRRATHGVALPVARWGLYGSAAIYDHLARQWFAVAVDLPDHPGRR